MNKWIWYNMDSVYQREKRPSKSKIKPLFDVISCSQCLQHKSTPRDWWIKHEFLNKILHWKIFKHCIHSFWWFVLVLRFFFLVMDRSHIVKMHLFPFHICFIRSFVQSCENITIRNVSFLLMNQAWLNETISMHSISWKSISVIILINIIVYINNDIHELCKRIVLELRVSHRSTN